MEARPPVPPSPGSRWGSNAATAFGAAALSLFLLEVSVRLYDGISPFSYVNFVAQKLDSVRKDTGVRVEYDERVGWVQASGIRWVDPNYGFYTTGMLGARMSGDDVVPLQEGAIVAVGDSFLAGSEVSNAESWPAQLEKSVGTQVINLGNGGYGLDQSVLRAEDVLSRLKPRFLLVQTRFEFGVLILSRMSVYGGAPKPYFSVQNGKLSLNNVPVPRLASHYDDIGPLRSVLGYFYIVDFVMKRLDLLQWWIGSATLNRYAITTEQALDVACLLMRRLGKVVTDNGVAGGVVIQYSGPEVMKSEIPWHRDLLKIGECARDAGLGFVDTLDELRRLYQRDGIVKFRELWVMHDNDQVYGHMSAAGNAVIAKIVREQLFPRAVPVRDGMLFKNRNK